MSDYTKPIRPIITGTPDITGGGRSPAVKRHQDPSAFAELLRSQIAPQSGELTLSKHAQMRAQQRGIDITEADMQRLGEAAGKAGEKGLRDTLVIMDSSAFIINVPNRVVVTMVDNSDKQQVFTNIDGAVIA